MARDEHRATSHDRTSLLRCCAGDTPPTSTNRAALTRRDSLDSLLVAAHLNIAPVLCIDLRANPSLTCCCVNGKFISNNLPNNENPHVPFCQTRFDNHGLPCARLSAALNADPINRLMDRSHQTGIDDRTAKLGETCYLKLKVAHTIMRYMRCCSNVSTGQGDVY